MERTEIIERLVDGGFEALIQKKMDVDEYENMVERALDGEKYAQDEYFTKFRVVVGEVSDELLEDLRLCMYLLGQEEGIEEFLNRLSIRVDVFVEEVEDLLWDHLDEGHLPMEEAVEVELEDLVLDENPPVQGVVFRFWAPGEGIEPLVEFTALDPERTDYVLTDLEALIVVSYMDDLKWIVEDTLHDLENPQNRK